MKKHLLSVFMKNSLDSWDSWVDSFWTFGYASATNSKTIENTSTISFKTLLKLSSFLVSFSGIWIFRLHKGRHFNVISEFLIIQSRKPNWFDFSWKTTTFCSKMRVITNDIKNSLKWNINLKRSTIITHYPISLNYLYQVQIVQIVSQMLLV